MNIMFIAPRRKALVELYRTVSKSRGDKVTWFSGVFHDLYRYLAESSIYLREVSAKDPSKDEIKKVDLRAFDVAVVDMSADAEYDTMLDFDGSARPEEIVQALTLCGVVVIGVSRDGRFNQRLEEAGAVMSAAHDRLAERFTSMMREARRLVRDNSNVESGALKALTLRQPWAAAIFLAGKDIENRFWPARVRGTIAIHVAKDQPKGTFEAGARFIHAILRKKGMSRVRFKSLDSLPQGAIIGLVDLVDCVADDESPWFEGPLGFKLANPRLLAKPIKVSGKRRFWSVPKAIELRIKRDLGEQGLDTSLK